LKTETEITRGVAEQLVVIRWQTDTYRRNRSTPPIQRSLSLYQTAAFRARRQRTNLHHNILSLTHAQQHSYIPPSVSDNNNNNNKMLRLKCHYRKLQGHFTQKVTQKVHLSGNEMLKC